METNEYQHQAMTTCMDSCDNMIYSALGMVAEVGEICDKLAKFVRKGKINFEDNQMVFRAEVTSEEADKFREELAKEVGDVQWFVAHMAMEIGYSLQKVCDTNLSKLASRQERGVIDGNGDNR